MKTIRIIAFLIALHVAGIATPDRWGNISSEPEIVFETRVFDFGTIKRHADGTCAFVFSNRGGAPLMISKVTASCGCTIPSYPKEPVLPGKTEEIKVKYNTKTLGVFSKTIHVSTNDPVHPTVVLTIKGAVVK
jgi:hypothetical protein